MTSEEAGKQRYAPKLDYSIMTLRPGREASLGSPQDQEAIRGKRECNGKRKYACARIQQ